MTNWCVRASGRCDLRSEVLSWLLTNVAPGWPCQVTFKHEPFIMHVLCRNVAQGQRLLRTAVASGFRESGMSAGTYYRW